MIFSVVLIISGIKTYITDSNNKFTLDKVFEGEVLPVTKIESNIIVKPFISEKVKVGKNGKTFGTISSKQIAEELNKKGFNIDKKIIELDHQIDTLGIHKVSIKLHKKVVASLTVSVKEV